MEKDFLAFSQDNKLIEKGDHILIGVSGGMDSIVLLDILINLQEKLQLLVAVAHVNYGLRADSDRDNEFVRDLAKKYDLQFFEKKVKLSGSNVEEKARDIRYDFFNKVAKREKFNKVAVAHHKNDLVETFLLNIARGSGLDGMISMKPSSGSLIRPLLFTTREDIQEYASRNKLENVEDVTNADLSIKRNLVRHKVIPALEGINSNLLETITREIETLREFNDLQQEIVNKNYKKQVVETASSTELSVESLSKLHPYLKSVIIRQAILHTKGSLKNITSRHINSILQLTERKWGTKKVSLPEGLIVKRTYDKIKIEKQAKSSCPKPKEINLQMNEEVTFGTWRLFLSKENKKTQSKNKNLVFLDIQKVPTLLVRCKHAGDKIKISKGKNKSLKDLFVDEKIPREDRDSYPVVTDENDKVIWVPGIRASHDYLASSESKQVIIIKATKEPH